MGNLCGITKEEKGRVYDSKTDGLGFDLRKDSLTVVANSKSLKIFRQEHTTPCQRWFRENGPIRGGIALDDLQN